LILPILYIETPGLKDESDKIAVEISKRQWIDWRDIRFASLTSAKMNKKLASLAKQICGLIENTEAFQSSLDAIQNETPPDSVVEVYASETVKLQDDVNLERSWSPFPEFVVPSEKPEEDTKPLQITIFLHTTSDKERDRRRIKTIYGTLISFHGRDRFNFQVFENDSGYLIDFPHDTTRVCPELLELLRKLMEEESWSIEEITFH
jgi:hypothetical protein